MAAWTFATVWDTVAQAHPDRIALAHGDRRLDWRSTERRAAGIAATLCGAGLGRGDKVALYLHNAPEYMEAAYAAMKAGLVPVNTNYRYVADELLYLWTNADAAAVVFHAAFTATAEALRGRCPAVRLWLHVDDGSGSCPSWAQPYEQAAAMPHAAHLTSGDDQILIYTGGTTGLPRGVMWRQHDLYLASNASGDAATFDAEAVRGRLSGPGPIGLPAAPLMHGTGFVFAATILNRGGTVLTLAEPKFDADRLLDAIGRERVTDLCIVGDAFCRPMVETLEQEPGRYDLSSLKIVSSSGMMWSPAVKARLLVHAPDVLMIDFLNASEASGLGRSLTSARKQEAGARFRLGENAFVLDDDDRPMPPGTGRPGRLAVRGRVPLGYYKDPVKTAATFPTIAGVRYAVPGDYAIVEADGSITLLGRGSISINTGGEKVFPEEVEEAVKTFPAVRDALVVGVPDPRFGQVVAAAIEPVPGQTVERHALLAHLHGRLAPHKLPRIVMAVDTIGRAPNGKADYRAMAGRVAAWHQPGVNSAMDTPHVLYDVSDGIATVTLNRPEKRNAFSPEMIVRLCDIWTEIAADPAIRVVLLTGAGDQAFSSGGDLGTTIPLMMRTRPPVGVWEERFSADRKQLYRAILRGADFFKPVVAAINGHALAGGAEMILGTDIRVMSDNAMIGVTEVRRGLIAGGGSLVRLARQIPWAQAMELALVGEPITAQQALAVGLVNRIVPPGQVMDTARDFARRIGLGAPVALAKTKEAMVRSNGRPFEEAFAIEAQCTKDNAKTADAREGPNAFMEKRPPRFTGQ